MTLDEKFIKLGINWDYIGNMMGLGWEMSSNSIVSMQNSNKNIKKKQLNKKIFQTI